MSHHPASHRLEEVALKEGDAEAVAHVASCELCAAYVQRLQEGARAFAADPAMDAAEFVRQVAARKRVFASGASRLYRLVWIGAPAAIAAAILLFVRAPRSVHDVRDGTSARLTTPPSADVPPAAPERQSYGSLPETRFKGGVQLAAVIEHGGQQERVTREVRARRGDRLRIEVSIDQGQRAIVAGVLEKNGTWTPLLSAALLDAGTHFSEQAARFDDKPTDGWVLAGAPEDVERARRTREFLGVAVLPILASP
jgi:hypothetical protein